MPYVFDQIDQQLNQNGDQKQDIFGQGQTPQGTSQTGAPATDQVQKTDNEGDLGPSTGGSGTTSKTQEITPNDRQAALNLQTTRQSAPKITQTLGQKINDAGNNLQNEADTYVQGYQNQDYREGVDKDTLGKAVQGDTDAYSKAFNRVNKQNYGDVDAFNPQTNTDFNEVKNLESTGGIKNLFKTENGPKYSDSDAAFDTMLLTRNPQFRQVQQALAQQQKALTETKAKDITDYSTNAQNIANQKFADASQGLRSDLGAYQQQIIDPLQLKASAETAKRADISPEAYAEIFEKQQIKALQDEASKNPGIIGNPRAIQDIQIASPDLKDVLPYITFNKNVGWQDYADQPSADQYNRILTLLGQGGTPLQVGSGPKAEADYNVQGFRDALIKNATTRRSGEEAQYQQQFQQIMDSLNAQANASANLRGRDVGTFSNPILDSLRGSEDPNKAIYQNILLPEAIAKINPNDYYHQASKLGGIDFASADQAAQLNRLAAETGQTANYAAGGNKQTQDQFDSDAYRAALMDYLAKTTSTGSPHSPMSDQETIDYWKERAAQGDKAARDLLQKAADFGTNTGGASFDYARQALNNLTGGGTGSILGGKLPEIPGRSYF